jgi:Cysteine-rich secretory protein family
MHRRFAAARLLFVAASTSAQTAGVRPPTVAEQYLQAAADQERSALHLPPLRRDPALVAAATRHARLMVAHNDISHQYPGEPEVSERAAAVGARFSVISENVAEGPTALEIQDAWMHSPGHRRNLLDPSVDAVGIAVVARGDQLFAVEDFERTVQHLTLREQEATVAALLAPYGLSVLPATADARKTCAMDTGFVGTRRPLFVMRYSGGDLNRLPMTLENHLRTGHYTEAMVGACSLRDSTAFTTYSIAVLLY